MANQSKPGYKYVSSRACPAKEPKKTYWAWVKYKPSRKPGINLRALDWGPGQLAAMSWNYPRFANLSGVGLDGALR